MLSHSNMSSSNMSSSNMSSSNMSSSSMSNSAISPASVTHALNQPTFVNQHKNFWHMLCFLFSDYNQEKVWKQLPIDTIRKVCVQLDIVVESMSDYAVLQSNRDLLFHIYIMIITKVKHQQTVSQLMYNETPEFLAALHNLYKHILQLKFKKVPLFGHTNPMYPNLIISS